ncbi:hypothetical protein PIB30_031850 [Stylosanthes scabra]|uniref:Uncharacterized protein n=1 Tax=Stylosanthes scabra TaxID=79078 RepID=A0ABU6UAR2_9FABA|nr:hypothetical protein [Stylosanthes scabra]
MKSRAFSPKPAEERNPSIFPLSLPPPPATFAASLRFTVTTVLPLLPLLRVQSPPSVLLTLVASVLCVASPAVVSSPWSSVVVREGEPVFFAGCLLDQTHGSARTLLGVSCMKWCEFQLQTTALSLVV